MFEVPPCHFLPARTSLSGHLYLPGVRSSNHGQGQGRHGLYFLEHRKRYPKARTSQADATMNAELLEVGKVRKGSCGRRGLPQWFIQDMWDDYQALGSTHKVARKYGRTAQSIWDTFRNRRLKMKPGPKAISRTHPRIRFDGRDYFWITRRDAGHTHSYFRCSTRGREPLHRAMWIKLHGPIPAGLQVSLRNGNFRDVRPENLFCGTPAEITRHHFARLRPDIASLSAEEQVLRRRRVALANYYRKKKKFQAQGLRCDGKPRSRRRLPEVDVNLAEQDLAAAWSKFRNQMAA